MHRFFVVVLHLSLEAAVVFLKMETSWEATRRSSFRACFSRSSFSKSWTRWCRDASSLKNQCLSILFRYFLWIKILWQLPNVLIWRHWIQLHLKIRGTSIYMFHTQTFQNCSPIKWKIHSKNLCNILCSTVDGAYTRPCKVAFFQNSITCHHQNQPPPNVVSKSQLPSDVLLQPPTVADQDQGASTFVNLKQVFSLRICVQWNVHNHPIIQMVLIWYLLYT